MDAQILAFLENLPRHIDPDSAAWFHIKTCLEDHCPHLSYRADHTTGRYELVVVEKKDTVIDVTQKGIDEINRELFGSAIANGVAAMQRDPKYALSAYGLRWDATLGSCEKNNHVCGCTCDDAKPWEERE